MQTIYVLRGIPGSGKSTLARKMCENPNILRFNMDDFRSMISQPYSKECEAVVKLAMESSVKIALKQGFDVVYDNVNMVTPEWMKDLGATIVVINVEIPLEEAIRRDSLRPNPVGEGVVTKWFNRFEKLKNEDTSKD